VAVELHWINQKIYGGEIMSACSEIYVPAGGWRRVKRGFCRKYARYNNISGPT
jgi:hypothetical protein